MLLRPTDGITTRAIAANAYAAIAGNAYALAANAAGAGPRDRPCMQWEPKARNRMHWLRLQAIVFNPRRPSAMIGGKTLFVGDRVGDMRVMAIDKESATLTGAGQTNVLVLSE